MKNKLFQLYMYAHRIDRRYIQYAYMLFMLAMLFIQGSPEDGSGGTR